MKNIKYNDTQFLPCSSSCIQTQTIDKHIHNVIFYVQWTADMSPFVIQFRVECDERADSIKYYSVASV